MINQLVELVTLLVAVEMLMKVHQMFLLIKQLNNSLIKYS
jgi:hypothetical protein